MKNVGIQNTKLIGYIKLYARPNWGKSSWTERLIWEGNNNAAQRWETGEKVRKKE